MFADQKAQEIGLALIKISVYARREDYRRRIEGLAFQLLEDVSARDFAGFTRTSQVLEGIIRLGKTVYEIEPVNADMLLQEIGNLNAAIRQIAELSLPDLERMPNLEGIFSKPRTLFDTAKEPKRQKNSGNAAIAESEIRQDKSKSKASDIDESGNFDRNQATRQAAIIDKIRQSGPESVKLKDIIAAFPDYSDRTLRYDLQRLCNQGIIERVGTGGPATYYKVREM